MRILTIAALIIAQVAGAAAPARAADLISAEPAPRHETGAFFGARLRVPLDGERAEGGRRLPRLTLTAGPTLRSVRPDGETRTRIGNGLEFGLQGEELRFDLAGQPLSRLVQGGEAPDGRRSNISTIGWVAIGVGAAAVTLFVLYGLCGSGEICDTDDD